MPRKPAPHTRERILATADRLFYTKGVHAVGVQEVIDECGCGKNLLYREFPSKDDLVVAYLKQRQAEWRATIDAAIAPFAGDPVRQLLTLVRTVVEQVGDPDWRGCPFNRADSEFSNDGHPIHQEAVTQRRAQLDLIRDLAAQTGAADPDTLAARLQLIMDGVGINGAMLGPNGPSATAVTFAEEVIARALREPTHP
jgi:AcrR family transcriptional regulator